MGDRLSWSLPAAGVMANEGMFWSGSLLIGDLTWLASATGMLQASRLLLQQNAIKGSRSLRMPRFCKVAPGVFTCAGSLHAWAGLAAGHELVDMSSTLLHVGPVTCHVPCFMLALWSTSQ